MDVLQPKQTCTLAKNIRITRKARGALWPCIHIYLGIQHRSFIHITSMCPLFNDIHSSSKPLFIYIHPFSIHIFIYIHPWLSFGLSSTMFIHIVLPTSTIYLLFIYFSSTLPYIHACPWTSIQYTHFTLHFVNSITLGFDEWHPK
jgi:hypothetical protein